MTLRIRLILTIAGIAILLVIPAAYAVTQLQGLTAIASTQRSQHGLAYEAVGALQARLSEVDRLARNYLVNPGTQDARKLVFGALDSARLRFDQLDTANYTAVAAHAKMRVDSLA
ncbi:MAG: hypothetical protein ACRELX_03575, partial [Longimicrobiales bacterium]